MAEDPHRIGKDGPSTPAPSTPKAPTAPPVAPSAGNDLYAPQYVWDTPDDKNSEFDFGSDAPGFAMGQNMTLAQYQEFWTVEKTKPWVNAMVAAYGSKFQEFWWFAYRSKMDPTKVANTLAVAFPGFEKVGGGGNGPSGYRGGGGGGGGMTKAQQIAAAEAEIRNQVKTLGLNLGDNEIKAIAGVVVKDSWSGAQLTDYLLTDPTRVTNPGSIRDMQTQIKAMGKAQLINVSDASAAEWAKRIMSGEMDVATVGSIMQAQATTEFAWAAEQLAAGATMRDLLMPARDMIANELELAPDQVDLMDTRWRDMAQLRNQDGTARAATLTEVQRAARKDTGWATTNGAARLASQTAMMIRNVFEG